MGLSGFYRGYLQNYAQRTVAMRRCLEVCRLDKNRTQLWDAWNAACKAERDDMCKLLQCSQCGPLAHPQVDREFIFACDGCYFRPAGGGGVLEQCQDDGSVRPIGYASRALRYLYWAIHPRFKHIIITDHAALKWMDSMIKHHSPSNRQLVRFSL